MTDKAVISCTKTMSTITTTATESYTATVLKTMSMRKVPHIPTAMITSTHMYIPKLKLF